MAKQFTSTEDMALRRTLAPNKHSSSSAERREHGRIDVTTPCALLLSDRVVLNGMTSNVSFRGASLTLDAVPEFKLPSHCRLTLELDIHATTVIEIHAKIERVVHNRVALQFFSTDIKSYNHLRNLLLLSTHAPQQLLKELAHRPGVAVA